MGQGVDGCCLRRAIRALGTLWCVGHVHSTLGAASPRHRVASCLRGTCRVYIHYFCHLRTAGVA